MSAPVAAPEEKSEENVRSFSIPKEVAVTENGVEEKNASNFGHSAVKTMWLVGDIVWSKIPGHPWWPSMVAYEPNTAAYFKYSGRTRYYHVQFFGHQPMRGWATEKSIVLYQGKILWTSNENFYTTFTHTFDCKRMKLAKFNLLWMSVSCKYLSLGDKPLSLSVKLDFAGFGIPNFAENARESGKGSCLGRRTWASFIPYLLSELNNKMSAR